jgi:hypothetical protein
MKHRDNVAILLNWQHTKGLFGWAVTVKKTVVGCEL